MCVCVYVCVYVCAYVYMYVCMHVVYQSYGMELSYVCLYADKSHVLV